MPTLHEGDVTLTVYVQDGSPPYSEALSHMTGMYLGYYRRASAYLQVECDHNDMVNTIRIVRNFPTSPRPFTMLVGEAGRHVFAFSDGSISTVYVRVTDYNGVDSQTDRQIRRYQAPTPVTHASVFDFKRVKYFPWNYPSPFELEEIYDPVRFAETPEPPAQPNPRSPQDHAIARVLWESRREWLPRWDDTMKMVAALDQIPHPYRTRLHLKDLYPSEKAIKTEDLLYRIKQVWRDVDEIKKVT